MKQIQKKDLQLILALLKNTKVLSESDFAEILDRFGDDYFIGDSRQLERTKENEEMRKYRHLSAVRDRQFISRNCVVTDIYTCPVCNHRISRMKGERHAYCFACGAPIIKPREEDEG